MIKKNKILWLTMAVLIVTFALPYPVSAAPLDDDRVIFGETYTLESGRILDGNLILIGGVVNIQTGAVVSGDMFALGSAGTIDGTIEGNLITIGGTIALDDNAVIKGDMISPTSFITQEESTVIEGEKYEGWNFPLSEINISPGILPDVTTSSGTRVLSVFNRIAEMMAVALALLALAALLLLIIPKPAEVMTDALSAEPWHMLGYGALTALVMLVGGVILTVTICMIPVVILAGLSFGLAVLTGWLVLGYELGKRIASIIFKTTWHPVLSAVIGNFVIYLIAKGLDFIPCIGGFLVFVAAMFGLGMVVVTLFGTNPYPHKEDREGGQVVLNPKEETEKEIEGKKDNVKEVKEVKKERKTSKKTSKKSSS
jgi:hypothetical protein